MITANIAFPKDALSILAILVPIHKNIESIATRAINPIMPTNPNAAIVIKLINFSLH